MSLAGELAPFLVLALLGSVHCAGMCGGFSIAIAAASPARRRSLIARQFTFLIGKALTYAMLGVAAAFSAHALAHGGLDLARVPASEQAPHLSHLRSAMAVLAGAFLVAFGLEFLGLHIPRPPIGRRCRAVAASIGRLWRHYSSAPGILGPLGAGLLTGLLPCGLSWSALALGASTSPPVAGLGLFLFGLGTAPVLVLVALGWKRLSSGSSAGSRRVLGVLMLGFGLMTALRGGLPGTQAAARATLPPCCVEPAPLD